MFGDDAPGGGTDGDGGFNIQLGLYLKDSNTDDTGKTNPTNDGVTDNESDAPINPGGLKRAAQSENGDDDKHDSREGLEDIEYGGYYSVYSLPQVTCNEADHSSKYGDKRE